jgi:hypothetical protein
MGVGPTEPKVDPRLRVQQAAGLRTKASNKELEQRECPALTTPSLFQFSYLFAAVKSALN